MNSKWRHGIGMLIMAMMMALASGCVTRHGDFTVISHKLVRLSEFELDSAERVKGVTGKDIQHIITCIPIGGIPTLYGAMDDAVEKGGGDVMTDASVTAWDWWIPFIYGQKGWSVKGDVVKTRRN